ncbi:hypothetical protein TNCV_4071721 [Trichonephila clavipes]|uniref:Uncharacterized protein n=1 Tax=Trichonephila clavipes TaxID=2585209 RepID=A0A8X6W803_TRICX|nr:hypothetical protein TNCV_4071721 [Trichonephila clavipes]
MEILLPETTGRSNTSRGVAVGCSMPTDRQLSVPIVTVEPPPLQTGQIQACHRLSKEWVNINVALFGYTRAFGDGPRHSEPWSSDENDT